MILSDASIRDRSGSSGLIYPYKEDQLQPCSYDVTLDDWIIRYTVDDTGIDRYISAANRELVGIHYLRRQIGTGYLLDPGEFILGSTREAVSLPNGIGARFEGKSSLGRLGLATHVTAGFIDPGFRGTITLEIKNENTFPIMLETGMRIGQLAFFTLDRDSERPYGSKDLGSHYQNQHTVTEARA